MGERPRQIVGITLVLVGAQLGAIGMVGVVSSDRQADDLSYLISGGMAGLACLGLGVTLLVSADLGARNRALRRLAERCRTRAERHPTR